MVPKCLINPEELYRNDLNLKKQDVQIIQEWLKKQPHLPELHETQILLFLYSCYYRIEDAKTTIDKYFTTRNLCPEIFVALSPELLKSTLQVGFINVLPNKTPEGFTILMIKLRDTKSENFNCANFVNVVNMVSTLAVHQNGFGEAIALFDAKGFTMGHLTRIDLSIIKSALYQVQEAAPVRIKGIHVVNPIALADKLLLMLKPFIKSELYKMIKFHQTYESLHKMIPKNCLPEEYQGELPSSEVLKEDNIKNAIENYEFFNWHDSQKVNESLRIGKSSNVNNAFGTEGTFKKLEID